VTGGGGAGGNNMNELEEARLERDANFSAFVEESAKAT
jgi:hypothetical protein